MVEFFPLKTFKHTAAVLSERMERHECESLAYLVMEKAFQLSRTHITTDRSFVPDDSQQLKYQVIMSRLLQNEPIQYILKETEFYGRTFYVNPSVLIPRQETEYLIHLIKGLENWDRPKIADIGTGSGCIACTLSLEIRESDVYAYDLSLAALKVANKNNQALQSQVQFDTLDILTQDIPLDGFDLIVSNPPYVTNKEKADMHTNVLAHEPHLALFVSDEDPLVFYKSIAEKSKQVLTSGGVLFFEINEQFGNQTLQLLLEYGYDQVLIHQDLNGKERFVSAKLP